MKSIEEASLDISKGIMERELELRNELQLIDGLIAKTAKEFKEAADQGDHSENAAYSEAKDELNKLNTQKLYLFRELESITAVASHANYVPKTYIGLYSTFRLERLDTGEVSTWKIYPGSISDINRSMMSSESPIYKTLEGREKGDIIRTTNKVSGKVLQFKILEVY